MNGTCAPAQLRARLRAGDFLLGTHIHANDPTLTELLGQRGFDYLWIDTEHTAIDYQTLQLHLLAARAAGCPALVRVPWNESYLVKRVLDQGADGVIFPMIRSVQEAREALSSCLYPPAGSRSYGPIRAAGYGAQALSDYIGGAEQSFLRLLQIEHVDAVACLPEILALPGLDGLILGPCDLSGSAGLLGDMAHPRVQALLAQTISACRDAGIPVGVSLGACGAEAVLAWKARGVQMVSAHSEYSYVLQGAEQLVRGVRNETARQDTVG